MSFNRLSSLILADKEREKNKKVKNPENGSNNLESQNEDDEIEILTYDETITYETLYETSLFYQHFKRLGIESTAFVRSKIVNNFYCPSFALLLLQKYMAILPL